MDSLSLRNDVFGFGVFMHKQNKTVKRKNI